MKVAISDSGPLSSFFHWTRCHNALYCCSLWLTPKTRTKICCINYLTFKLPRSTSSQFIFDPMPWLPAQKRRPESGPLRQRIQAWVPVTPRYHARRGRRRDPHLPLETRPTRRSGPATALCRPHATAPNFSHLVIHTAPVARILAPPATHVESSGMCSRAA